jgi:NAD-dependent dihydropyrimidine dehydrogenase PreA subunit
VKREVTKNIMLHYPRHLTEKPVISDLIKKYDLTINISRARIDPDEEGTLVIELAGLKENVDAGLGFLKDLGVVWKPVSKVIERNDDKCTHCGACTIICPTGALVIEDRATMLVSFVRDGCVACGLCVPACPYRAMEMSE